MDQLSGIIRNYINIKINNKILHQSKLINYFKDESSSKNITKDLNDLLKIYFSPPLIAFALILVTIFELISGILCLIGIVDFIFNKSNLIGFIGLIIGSLALLILLFGQRVSKNYDGAKTITIYFILAMIGIALAQPSQTLNLTPHPFKINLLGYAGEMGI